MSAFGIAAHEIVGYCTGHEFVCTGCVGDADDTDDCTPVFACDEEADTTCDECGETLMESYTGVRAERDPDTKELLSDELDKREAHAPGIGEFERKPGDRVYDAAVSPEAFTVGAADAPKKARP